MEITCYLLLSTLTLVVSQEFYNHPVQPYSLSGLPPSHYQMDQELPPWMPYETDGGSYFDTEWHDVGINQDHGYEDWSGIPRLTKKPINQMLDYMRMLNELRQRQNY